MLKEFVNKVLDKIFVLLWDIRGWATPYTHADYYHKFDYAYEGLTQQQETVLVDIIVAFAEVYDAWCYGVGCIEGLSDEQAEVLLGIIVACVEGFDATGVQCSYHKRTSDDGLAIEPGPDNKRPVPFPRHRGEYKQCYIDHLIAQLLSVGFE